MYKNFDDVKKLTEDNTKKLTESTAVVTKGVQAIATEAADFSKKALEASTAAIQEISAVKSVEAAVELQMKHGKKAYEDSIAYSTKLSEMSTAMLKDAFKPFESMFKAAAASAPAPVVKSSNKAA